MNQQTPIAAETPVTIPNAVQFDMESKNTGRTYRIFVAKPAYSPPDAGYPVVVTTDANMMFPIAASLSGGFGGSFAALIVGVGYPISFAAHPMLMRTRDLTPPTPLSRIQPQPGMPAPAAENFGGAEAFYRFLVEELRPAIAAEHPVDPENQTLYGHSLGGLFTLNVMFAHPLSFRSFAASSPSIWWNRRALLRDEAAFAARVEANEAAPRVLITIGAREQEVPDPLPPNMTRAQTRKLITKARMVDNARELAERLKALKGRAPYDVSFAAFDDEDHATVVAASISRTLAFARRG